MAKARTSDREDVRLAEEPLSGGFEPAYLKLLRSATLFERARLAEDHD